MPTELVAKSGQDFIAKVGLTTRTEAFVQRGTEDGRRDRFIDGGCYCPAPLPRIRHPASELSQVGAIEERGGGVGIKERAPVPTLAEFADRSFIPHIVARKSKKPKTVVFYQNSVVNLLAFEKLGGARLDRIDVPLIDAFITHRRMKGRQISTINRELATLRRMFNLLPDLRPDISISLPRVKLQPGENRRERVISPKEEEMYLGVAPPLLFDVAIILIDCGFRPEEAYGLKWAYIRNGNIQNYEGKTTRAGRSVPATPRSMEILEKRFETASGEWIFPAETKSGHAEQSSIKKQHATALKLSKIAPFVIYSLRHTCLTRWAESGMNPYELMRRAGHADLETTMRYVNMPGPQRTD